MPKTSVVILTYERPIFLREALRSCAEAAEVIVLDDGSKYDVRSVVKEVRPDAGVYLGPARTPEQHVDELNFVAFLRAGTTLATMPYITFLCDDDQLAPGWLPIAEATLDGEPLAVATVGSVVTAPLPTPAIFHTDMFTLGNFVVRREHVVWTHLRTVSPEIQLWRDFTSYNKKIIRLGATALFGRSHPRNLSATVDCSNDQGRFVREKALAYYREI